MKGGKAKSKERTDKGIPRKEIPWYPAIDEVKCTACGTCVDFCQHGVYVIEDKARVANPLGCIVGCTGCVSKCPEGAISFPDLREFTEALRRLRAKRASRKK